MMSSAAIVTLIFSLKVIFTPIALRIFLKKKLHFRILTGGLLGVLGVCLLLYPTLSNFQGISDLKGHFLELY